MKLQSLEHMFKEIVTNGIILTPLLFAISNQDIDKKYIREMAYTGVAITATAAAGIYVTYQLKKNKNQDH